MAVEVALSEIVPVDTVTATSFFLSSPIGSGTGEDFIPATLTVLDPETLAELLS